MLRTKFEAPFGHTVLRPTHRRPSTHARIQASITKHRLRHASVLFFVILAILASIIVAWFSRRREYRADTGGAELASREKMIAALQRLQMASGEATLPDQLAAFGIAGGGGLKDLFRSHPPLEERIEALRRAQ